MDASKANSAAGYLVAAGLVTFLGNFKQQGGYPSNTPKVFLGTSVLAVGAAFASKTPIAEPVRWLAIITLMVAVIKWVPVLSNSKKR